MPVSPKAYPIVEAGKSGFICTNAISFQSNIAACDNFCTKLGNLAEIIFSTLVLIQYLDIKKVAAIEARLATTEIIVP